MDIIFYNGIIYSMDENRRTYEAIGIKGNKIGELGNSKEILNLKTDKTKIIDLQGKIMVPGFNDSHMHLLNYGISLGQVDLVGTKSIDEIESRISNFIEANSIEYNKWVRGRGWNQDYFQEEKIFPNRYDLDKISKNHPIIINRICGHVVVVNSKALEILNIHKDKIPVVEGGQIDIDEDGEPTGVFREYAIDLANKGIDKPDKEELKEIILGAVEKLNADGITSVASDDFGVLNLEDYEQVIEAYVELKEENKLNIRVYEQCGINHIGILQGFFEKGYKTGWGNEKFKIGPLKLLIDGSLGARTAAMVEPYEDDPNTTGIVTMTQKEMDKLADLANRNDTQIAIHGIGDRGMYMAFESIEKALEIYPRKDHRHGIVHCQITDRTLLKKFKDLGGIAYIQPIFLDYDWRIVRDRVGELREKYSYNWATMIKDGVNIACGSDSPVETTNVLYGIYEAVTRKDLQGNPENGWLPEQKLTVDEALYGYTMGGAFASFEENIKGSLVKGKLADMVVLSQDIFHINPDDIKNVKVEMTIMDGKIVVGL